MLNLLAANPRQRFTVTELARRLDIAKATCLGILGSLTHAGYVVRYAEGRTYGIGSVLLSLGRAAQDSFASLEVARPHLRRLTGHFGLSCTASTVIDDDIVVLERTGLAGDIDSVVKVGQRYPYAPPAGVVFSMWQPDWAVEHWLSSHPPVPIDHRRLYELARSSRRLGYLVERLSDVSVASYAILAGLTAASPPNLTQALNDIVAAFPYRYYLDADIQGPALLPVSLICAPTYSAQGLPDLLLAVLVLREVPAAQVVEYGSALSEAAAMVTKELGGTNPWLDA